MKPKIWKMGKKMSEAKQDQLPEPLAPYEYNFLLPAIKRGLKEHVGEANKITAKQIVGLMKERGYYIQGPRLRKMINYIRRNGILPVVSSSKGYYLPETKQEVEAQVESLRNRAGSIEASADGMEQAMETWFSG